MIYVLQSRYTVVFLLSPLAKYFRTININSHLAGFSGEQNFTTYIAKHRTSANPQYLWKSCVTLVLTLSGIS